MLTSFCCRNVKYISLYILKLLCDGFGRSIDRQAVLVGPCHHGMARPQVADRGMASDKEGSCE